MFFSSGGEFFLVAVFILIQLVLRLTGNQLLAKGWLLIGNLVLLLTLLSPFTLGYLVAVSSLVFGVGYFINKTNATTAKRVATGTVVLLIAEFCVRNYPDLYKAIDLPVFNARKPTEWLLSRLGMSYILFRHIQYIVDSYKGKIKKYNWLDYVNFILFFPNFLAGPIDVYNNFKRWQDKPEGQFKRALLWPGVARVFMGLIKKYAIVPLFFTEATDYTLLEADYGFGAGISMSLALYSIYIYLDFSGYSDIAIGTGYILGVRTPENFQSPYFATNIADFWRRWHITFSTFLRELIFKPIVKTIGKKLSSWPRLSVSIIGYILTFVICGIWHGHTNNFLYWGLWHGIGLAVYKAWSMSGLRNKLEEALSGSSASRAFSYSIAVLINFVFVTVGWVFFNYKPGPLLEIWEKLIG